METIIAKHQVTKATFFHVATRAHLDANAFASPSSAFIAQFRHVRAMANPRATATIPTIARNKNAATFNATVSIRKPHHHYRAGISKVNTTKVTGGFDARIPE